MSNYTYTVFTSNAGHSAKSPGAGANGYEEHTQARLCNKAFIKAMKERGRSVVDTTSDAANKTAVLQEQVAKANRVGGGKEQLDISWHILFSDFYVRNAVYLALFFQDALFRAVRNRNFLRGTTM